MSGYCEVDFSDASDDAEPCDFVNHREVVARKAHKCCACGGEIAAGDRHHVAAYKFDGEFGMDRTCDSCHETAAEFSYHLVGGAGVWDMMREEWDQGAHVQACINRLTTAKAKAHMRQQWLKWQEQLADQRRRVAALRASKRDDSGAVRSDT